MNKIMIGLLLAPFALVACESDMSSRTAPRATPGVAAGGSPSAQPSLSGTGTMGGSNMGNSAPVGTGRQEGTAQR
jgi:hypothetical protein